MYTQEPTYQVEKGDGITDRHEHPTVVELGHKYYLRAFPDFYFIVRQDMFYSDVDSQRVCLYRQGVVNVHRQGNSEPFDLLLNNELRGGRKLETLHSHMHEKVDETWSRQNR